MMVWRRSELAEILTFETHPDVFDVYLVNQFTNITSERRMYFVPLSTLEPS